MNEDEIRPKLISYFKEHKEIVFKSNELSLIFGGEKSKTFRKLRKIITELVEDFKLPIVSSNEGFCYTENPLKIKRCIKELEDRKLGIQRRILAYDKILGDNSMGWNRHDKEIYDFNQTNAINKIEQR